MLTLAALASAGARAAKTTRVHVWDSVVKCSGLAKEQSSRNIHARPRLVTVGEGLGALGDRRQTSSDFKEHGVPAAKWIEHRLQQGELPKKQIALQVCLNATPPPPNPTPFPPFFG